MHKRFLFKYILYIENQSIYRLLFDIYQFLTFNIQNNFHTAQMHSII